MYSLSHCAHTRINSERGLPKVCQREKGMYLITVTIELNNSCIDLDCLTSMYPRVWLDVCCVCDVHKCAPSAWLARCISACISHIVVVVVVAHGFSRHRRNNAPPTPPDDRSCARADGRDAAAAAATQFCCMLMSPTVREWINTREVAWISFCFWPAHRTSIMYNVHTRRSSI